MNRTIHALSAAILAATLVSPLVALSDDTEIFAGNPAVGVSGAKYTVVIARRFSVQGTSTMSNDFSGVSGGNPIKVTALVE